jgi:hypothetical protein
VKNFILLLIIIILIVACTGGKFDPASHSSSYSDIDIKSRTTTSQILDPAYTQTKAFTPSPSPSETSTPVSQILEATVWTSEPRAPILVYHRFLPDRYEYSTKVKMRLGDFKAHLEALYDNGYSLVSLGQWLDGHLVVPEGRRPLVLTIDDAFFEDQISLTEDGNPNPESGLGILWQFYQEHSDFGFHVALFPNLGDKLYPGGEEELARVIAWCIDHGAIPYNHFYTHPRLDLTELRWIQWEAEKNDLYLRELLCSISREDLIPQLGNILALPYGVWPDHPAAKQALLTYVSPEGKSLQAILEVDFAVRARYLLPPYSPDFDPWHVPRIVGTQEAIELLASEKDSFPTAQKCPIGPVKLDDLMNRSIIEKLILMELNKGACEEGDYLLMDVIYRVDANGITLLFP